MLPCSQSELYQAEAVLLCFPATEQRLCCCVHVLPCRSTTRTWTSLSRWTSSGPTFLKTRRPTWQQQRSELGVRVRAMPTCLRWVREWTGGRERGESASKEAAIDMGWVGVAVGQWVWRRLLKPETGQEGPGGAAAD